MNRKISVICVLLLLTVVTAWAQQPAWVKKATKSVFTLKTFSDDGTLLNSSNGFFVSNDGEALSCYQPFYNAAKAVVVAADGKSYDVECMLGANETYDVAKFRVNIKKSQPLPLAGIKAEEGSAAWLLPYMELKKVPKGTIRKAETFGGIYAYYTVAVTMPEQTVGTPLLNEEGLVIGIMQQPARQGDSLNYAVSARYADSLRITGLSLNDAALRATHIKKALPSTLDQTLLMLYMGQSTLDSAAMATLIDDVIRVYPTAPDGYQYRAQLAFQANDFAAAQRDMEKAIDVAQNKDEAHYSYSRLIYQKALYKGNVPYESWSLEKALEEARAASSINAQPVYQHQEALSLYALERYQDALDVYMQLANTPYRSADIFYEASKCKELMRDTLGQLALLDSAVNCFSRPYLKEAAPYLILRAQLYLAMGKYREAVFDMNDYEQLMKTQVNDNFYFLRYQASVGGRLFQQGLNDLEQAIRMRPDYDVYYSEKASLQVRVGLYEDAQMTAKELIQLSPNQSDGYLFLGLAQCLSGKKKEGRENLLKAKSLGDPQADDLIEKYSN